MLRTYIAFVLLIFVCVESSRGAINDPVQDYLETFSVIGGPDKILSDDLLLKIDLDLNNDGKEETLLSLARNRNGKQGNMWAVYTPSFEGYTNVESLVFSSSRFYLGPLEGGKFGLASFGPGGAGEGIMWGYVFNGAGFNQIKLGEVVRNRETNKLEGEEIVEKFLGEEVAFDEKAVTEITASELAEKYNIQVEPITYQEALQKSLSQSRSLYEQKQVPANLPHTKAVDQPKQQNKPLADIALTAEKKKPFPWFWIVAAIITVGGVVFFVIQQKRE